MYEKIALLSNKTHPATKKNGMKRESVTGAGDPGEGVPTGAEERRRLPAKTRHDHSQKRRAPKTGARPCRGRHFSRPA